MCDAQCEYDVPAFVRIRCLPFCAISAPRRHRAPRGHRARRAHRSSASSVSPLLCEYDVSPFVRLALCVSPFVRLALCMSPFVRLALCVSPFVRLALPGDRSPCQDIPRPRRPLALSETSPDRGTPKALRRHRRRQCGLRPWQR